MNCLDYRRILLTGEGETPAMRKHRLACAFCASLCREHEALESELRRAFEVSVPADLADRISESLRAQAVSAPPRIDRRRILAAAAAVGAGAVGVGLHAWFGRDDPMAMACIEFVMKEETKSIMMGAMPRAEAAAALSGALPIGRLDQIGKVMHIGPCPFQGGTAYHVVLMVPQDKVTLLVMPDSRTSVRGRAVHDGMYASVIPLRKGSVGIVGANAAVVDSVAGALLA